MNTKGSVTLPAGTYFFGDPGCVFDSVPTTSLRGHDWEKYTRNDFEDSGQINICNFGTEDSPLVVAYGGTTESSDGDYTDTELRYEFQVFRGQFGLVNLDQAQKHLPDLDIPSLSLHPAVGHLFSSKGPVVFHMPSDNIFSIEYEGNTVEVHTTDSE